MLRKVTHCTGCVLANTRPHQLCWGDREMGTHGYVILRGLGFTLAVYNLLELYISAVYTAYGHEAALARTFVDDVFGGVLVSTVKCNECNSVSLVRLPYVEKNSVTYILIFFLCALLVTVRGFFHIM